MQKIYIIKYGELNTKKDNIGLFLRTLKDNLSKKIKGEITYDKGRMFIKSSIDELDVLKRTFGIHEIDVGFELKDNSLATIEEAFLHILQEKDFKTFKIETKRSDKTYPYTSLEISKHFGGFVLKNKPNITVDVHHPEVTFFIEIRKDHAYIYSEKHKGLGGYPVGTLGKALLMLSGGIDSPVAGYLTMKRGVILEAIYFESPPYTSVEAKNKVLALAKKISEYGSDIKVHVIPFTKIQEAIYTNIPHEYMVTIMRRMMYRIASKIAYKNHCKVLVNGESIGQVASQTLESMSVINEVVTIPVIRPLACFDKLEIMELANKIKTYDISILPYEDCCTIFVPTHPVIYPEREKCLEYEQKIPYEELIKEAILQEEIISTKQKEEFSTYL